MSSLFGTNNQAQASSTGLFGNANQTNSATNNQPTGSSLFSNPTATSNTQPSSSLFGTNTNTTNPQPAAGASLFGSNTSGNQPTTGTSLFGSNTANAQPAAGASLFGSNPANAQPAAGTSLFGGNTANTQPAAGASLFSSNTANTQPAAGTSLFGNTASNTQTTSSLFQNPSASGARPNTLDRTFSNTASMLQSGLGGSHFGALGQASQTELAKSRLSQINFDARPNEKSIPERIQSLIRKWDPNSQETLLQDYTYNAVNAAYAPFYYKNADETEKEWEEALARKPPNMETKDGETVSFIPVLVRGFHALGQRAEVQARTVNEMRVRLHEMNNSLNAVMAKHQQNITVQLEAARRQHTVLSQRCLRLAVKVQILRNRGYALDSAEEALRKTLQSLEKQVFDPAFTGREEEIWARMVALRERTRWLEEEGKRLGQQAEEQSRQGVPEDVINKTKKILRDYDGQLVHLEKELTEVKKEFTEWDHARNSSSR